MTSNEAVTHTSPAELLEAIVRAAARDGQTVGLIALELGRSDHLRALVRSSEAQLVLSELVQRLRQLLKPHDVYSICSPTEIWIGLCRLRHEALASVAATSIQQLLSIPFELGSGEPAVKMQPTLGVVTAAGALSVPRLLSGADVALRRARRAGNSVHCVSIDTSRADDHDDGEMARSRVISALFNNQLELAAQPKVDLTTGSCIGAELLIRWPDSDPEPVPPQMIAAHCENAGLSEQLALFVMNTALRALSSVDTRHPAARFSINLSPGMLLDTHLPDLIKHLCMTWDVPASTVCIEITESTMMSSAACVVDAMHALRSLGCKLALDDFGTGFSSLSYLQKFPFDELKIDRAFVHDLESNELNRRLVRAIIEMAHAFGFRSVAEGIESEAVATYLKQAGCHIGQGWFFGRPMKLDAFVKQYLNDNVVPTSALTARAT